eukprot:4707135-Pyramimonas_sp.AAC.1
MAIRPRRRRRQLGTLASLHDYVIGLSFPCRSLHWRISSAFRFPLRLTRAITYSERCAPSTSECATGSGYCREVRHAMPCRGT